MVKRARILELLGSFIIAVLLGASLSLMIADSIGFAASSVAVYSFSCVVALLLSVAMYNKVCAFVSAGVAAIAAVIWALSPAQPVAKIFGLFGALTDYVAGNATMLTEHALPMALLLTFLLTLCLHWMSRMPGGVYPALTLSVIILMGSWLVDKRLVAGHVIPAAAALATMFARSPDDRLPYVRALPAGVLVAVLAFMLLPSGNPTYKPFSDAAERVRQMFYDYFMFTESRVTYSLYPDGFQPQGESLGGPATPNDGEVMLVKADTPLLLRGAIKRTYTGYSWTNSSINNRYLFVDPTKHGTRDAIFDSARPGQADNGKAFKRTTAEVTMLREGISTYFLPHRLQELSTSADVAIYYNSSGEVFITRGVQPGDTYGFSAMIPTGNIKDTDLLLSEMAQYDDPLFNQATADYTALPHGIESGVYDLTQSIVKEAKTPYQAAQRIMQHLMTSYTYNMDVPYPPQNRDFVSYFLLDAKQGYCSYFASAMTVMARIAGLPARYIEGYTVKPENGEKLVTGRNAHAWSEVYFKGVGWISFNPTPGDGDTQSTGGTEEEHGNPTPEEEPEETPPPEEESPEETPEPEGDEPEEPEETPSPEEEEPEEGEAEIEQEAEEEPEEEPDDATSDAEDGSEDPPNLWFLWLLILLLLLGIAVYWVWKRLCASDPARLCKRTDSDEDKLAIWYRALLTVLAQQGQTPEAKESPEQFAQRLKEAGLCSDPLLQLCSQFTRNRYAKRKPDSIVFKQAAMAYQAQIRAMRPLEKLNWYRKRIAHGLGDVKQIP